MFRCKAMLIVLDTPFYYMIQIKPRCNMGHFKAMKIDIRAHETSRNSGRVSAPRSALGYNRTL